MVMSGALPLRGLILDMMRYRDRTVGLRDEAVLDLFGQTTSNSAIRTACWRNSLWAAYRSRFSFAKSFSYFAYRFNVSLYICTYLRKLRIAHGGAGGGVMGNIWRCVGIGNK